jgi:DNA replication protein DnaC
LIDPLIRCDLLILDEFGYLTVEPQVGPVLYEIIAARYEKGATTLTSNKSLATWGELVGDSALMMAILDRRLASRGGLLFTRKFISPARERAGYLDDDQIRGPPVWGEALTYCSML